MASSQRGLGGRKQRQRRKTSCLRRAGGMYIRGHVGICGNDVENECEYVRLAIVMSCMSLQSVCSGFMRVDSGKKASKGM